MITPGVGANPEVVRPTPEWAKASPDTVLVYHQRVDNGGGCHCGGLGLGESHAKHLIDVLREAGWVVARADDVRVANRLLDLAGHGGLPAVDRLAALDGPS